MSKKHYKFKQEVAMSCPILFHQIYTRWILFPGDDTCGVEIGPGWYALLQELCVQIEKFIYTKPEHEAVKNYFMEITQREGTLDLLNCKGCCKEGK